MKARRKWSKTKKNRGVLSGSVRASNLSRFNACNPLRIHIHKDIGILKKSMVVIPKGIKR